MIPVLPLYHSFTLQLKQQFRCGGGACSSLTSSIHSFISQRNDSIPIRTEPNQGEATTIASQPPNPSNQLTMAPTLPTLAILAVVIPLLYIYTSSVAQTRFPTLRNRSVCLLIAHPDDEAMFFAPSVLALTRPEAGNHVKILCLSTGDADGLGETRRRELQRSGVLLGLRGEEDVLVVDSP